MAFVDFCVLIIRGYSEDLVSRSTIATRLSLTGANAISHRLIQITPMLHCIRHSTPIDFMLSNGLYATFGHRFGFLLYLLTPTSGDSPGVKRSSASVCLYLSVHVCP